MSRSTRSGSAEYESSLDNLDAFADRVTFLPVRARFGSSGGNLLELMVGPLYDDEPACGMRELIQNAVDACRELEDMLVREPDLALERPELAADVVVTVEEEQDGQGWITVADRGIGMSPDVIVNHYLKAGASLRDSHAWREQHLDPDGRPRAARSGRFGLGALATFLLGDVVHVTTRHARESKGLTFTASLDDPRIELRWDTEQKVGTTIRVRVTRREVFEALAYAERWYWYRLRHPSVVRRIHLQGDRDQRRNTMSPPGLPPPSLRIPPGWDGKLEQAEVVPHGENPLPAPWRRIPRADFGDVLWSLQRESGWADVANGIALRRPDAVSAGWQVLWPGSNTRGDFFLFRPRLAVIEGASLFDVDLRRTQAIGGLITGTGRRPARAGALRAGTC